MALSLDERDREIEGDLSTMPEDSLEHEIIEGEAKVIELDDGSAIIEIEEEIEEESSFEDNIAERIPKSERFQIASDLIELVEKDKKSREKRQQQYEEGIRRTGLGDDAPGGAQFNGASRVVHPMLAEACVDFEARAIKELMPSGGPVRTSITSEEDNDKLEVARLKRDILNLQLTKLIPEYRDELESLLSQLPMGGSQYMKIWFDGKRKRMEFIPIDHIFLPFSITNFYTSPRVTHQQFVTRQEFESRIARGLYLQEDKLVDPATSELDMGIVEKANNKIEGKEEADAYNEDGLRELYEIYLDYDFSEWDELAGEQYAPYVAHIDVFTSELLGLYRNWEEGDELYDKLHWIVDWGFIPWRGAYKLGLPHLIGGLSAAATGALRALLDSAHASNAPTLLKLRSGRLVGQTTEVAVTQVQEIEGPAGIDDIRKMVTPIPFAGPNSVLFQLLGFVVEAGKGVVTTAEEKISDVSDRMPVGTSLAMIEQGSKVFSAIHMRLHQSQAKVLEILCRLNAKYPELERWQSVTGKPVDPTIFANTDDISPVSDPNIFGEAQRYAQMQAVMQLMQDPTINYNRIEGHRRMLRLLNVPDMDNLLPEPPKPKKRDPVQENMSAVSGIPIKAFPDQDHLAHIECHLRFILSPMLGGGPVYSGQQIAPILAHVGEHFTMVYPQLMAQSQMLAVAQGMLLPNETPERTMAVGMANFERAMQSQLTPLMQMLQQAQQLVQSKMPPPPMDPQAQVAMQVAQMEDARAKLQAQADNQIEQFKLMNEQKQTAAEMQLEQQKLQMEQTFRQFELAMQERNEQLSQQVEMMKNDADNKQKQMTELLKNRDDNQTQVLIAQIKAELDAMRQSVTETQAQPKQDDSMLKEMQRLLGELKEAKTNNALEAVVQGLQAVIGGQQQHQERMLQAAAQLMQGE